MNAPTDALAAAAAILAKPLDDRPALACAGPATVLVAAGTTFCGTSFATDTPAALPAEGLRPGADYVVAIGADGAPTIRPADTLAACQADDVLGGFHYAPGGNATARSGGGETPAINPFSLWDLLFRPACPDPRGMTLIGDRGQASGLPRLLGSGPAPFWCDIYLTAADHLAGTSRFGATIADGNDPPEKAEGGRHDRFDYATAVAVMAHHGKQLLAYDEFVAAAYGVTEKTAAEDEPKKTGLDAPRTSARGLIQATGNMWVWGHDGDPDSPRASLCGGSWLSDDDAGSRQASVAPLWPGDSYGVFGARGRCDHLSPA